MKDQNIENLCRAGEALYSGSTIHYDYVLEVFVISNSIGSYEEVYTLSEYHIKIFGWTNALVNELIGNKYDDPHGLEV